MEHKTTSPSYIKFEKGRGALSYTSYIMLIDFDTEHLTIHTQNIETHTANKQIWELDNRIIANLLAILDYNSVMTFLDTPEEKLTESGYRDGWRLKYILVYPDKPILSGKLGTIYSESPFDTTLEYLRRECPNIKGLRHF